MAVDDGVPLLVGHLLDHVVPGVAGVVDDDVDATEVVDSGLDEAVGEIDSGHAAHAGNGFTAGSADFRNHFFSRSGVEVVDHDFGAVGSQLQGDLTANATAGAGYQGDFAFELFHCSVPMES
ncbi:hypothetical protein D9M71_772940 [compost metagenome]